MRFHALFRKASVGAVAVVAAFVAINMANVASAAPEHCSAWLFNWHGGTLKICGTVNGKSITGRIIISPGSVFSMKDTAMAIDSPDNPHEYAFRRNTKTISAKNLPAGKYKVYFIEDTYGSSALSSPDLKIS